MVKDPFSAIKMKGRRGSEDEFFVKRLQKKHFHYEYQFSISNLVNFNLIYHDKIYSLLNLSSTEEGLV